MEGIVEKPVIVFDKATGEFFEVKVRGPKLLNRFTMAGVEWVLVTPEAEDWARSRVSGRAITGSGKII